MIKTEAEYRKVINTVALNQKFSAQQTEILYSLGHLIVRGDYTAQVGNHSVNIIPSGTTITTSFSDSALAKQLFKDGYLQWKCFSKGIFITSSKCINPKTKRPISGFLYMTEKCLHAFGPALYELMQISFGTGRTSQIQKYPVFFEFLIQDATKIHPQSQLLCPKVLIYKTSEVKNPSQKILKVAQNVYKGLQQTKNGVALFNSSGDPLPRIEGFVPGTTQEEMHKQLILPKKSPRKKSLKIKSI